MNTPEMPTTTTCPRPLSLLWKKIVASKLLFYCACCSILFSASRGVTLWRSNSDHVTSSQYPLRLHITQSKNRSNHNDLHLPAQSSFLLSLWFYLPFLSLGVLCPRQPGLPAVIENDKLAASSGPLHSLCPLPVHSNIDISMIRCLIFFKAQWPLFEWIFSIPY